MQPESIWKAPRKAAAPPYAAAIHFLGREPDPPMSGSSSLSAVAKILDPPRTGSSSSAAIQLLLPSGATAAIAERCRPPQRGKTQHFWKARRHVRDVNEPVVECCNEAWFEPQNFVILRSNSGKKSNVGAASEVARDGTLDQLHDSTTESHQVPGTKTFVSWHRLPWMISPEPRW